MGQTMRIHDHWNGEERIDFRRFWQVIDRKKWPILGLVAIVSLLAAMVAFTRTPIYRASATLLIESKPVQVVSIEEIYGLDTRSQEYYATQFEILRGRPLAEHVVENLGLAEHPTLVPGDGRSVLPDWRAWLQFSDSGHPAAIAGDPLHAIIKEYFRNLSIQPVRNTQLVHVHFESEDPALAARVANAHADAYIDSMVDARLTVTESAAAWMTERLVEMEEALLESERHLQEYREQEKLIDVDGLRSLPAREVNDLTSRLVEVRRLLSQAEIAYLQVSRLEDASAEVLQGIPAMLNDELVREFLQAEAAGRQRVAELQERYGPQHPVMVAAQAELAEARSNLRAQQNSVATAIRKEFEAARAEEAALVRALGEAKQRYQEVGRKESQLSALQRVVDTNRKLYELFYNRVSETSATEDLKSAQARIIAPAVIPSFPVKPNKALMVGLAAFAATIVGLLVAFLQEALNNTVRSVADVEKKLQLPLLGMLPLLKSRAGKGASLGKVYFDKSVPGFSEVIRTVRTSLSLDNMQHPHKVIVVASSVRGEGKSTVAISLAQAFAQMEKVLLVDADLRHPSIGKALELPGHRPGLSELLAGDTQLDKCVVHNKDYTLDVLSSGFVPPEPLKLLSSQRLVNALMVLRRHYDRIIIDTPPILPVSDALVLAKQSDTVIFVAKCDATSTRQMNLALDSLARVDVRVSGVVVTHLDARKARKYGDYGYGGTNHSYPSRLIAG
jgi:capsular exopolysaccharide synthesis family protein